MWWPDEDPPLVVDVPAEVLGRGDYLVFLYLEDAGRRQIVAEYAFPIR